MLTTLTKAVWLKEIVPQSKRMSQKAVPTAHFSVTAASIVTLKVVGEVKTTVKSNNVLRESRILLVMVTPVRLVGHPVSGV